MTDTEWLEAITAAVDRGDFETLLGDRTEEWWEFVRDAAADPFSEVVLLRMVFGAKEGLWSAFVEYRLTATEEGAAIQLHGLYIPVEDSDDKHAAPEGLENARIFSHDFSS